MFYHCILLYICVHIFVCIFISTTVCISSCKSFVTARHNKRIYIYICFETGRGPCLGNLQDQGLATSSLRHCSQRQTTNHTIMQADVISLTTLPAFKRLLKTELFSRSFPDVAPNCTELLELIV